MLFGLNPALGNSDINTQLEQPSSYVEAVSKYEPTLGDCKPIGLYR